MSMLRISMSLVFLIAAVSTTHAEGQPNILIIMADDCTYNDLAIYGGVNAKTPRIDRLATEGLTFDQAYLCEAICQPCRAELYSGLYPMRNGCAWNHSASRPTITSLPQQLGELGYRTGLAGKVHVQPENAFPFEKVLGFDGNCVRNPTRPHDLTAVEAFMTRDGDQPFCLIVALVEPHLPWVMGDASEYPPKQLKLPANIADTRETREAFSRYLAEITYMDGQVGEILDVLDRTGMADDTLVLFTSEQGSQFPGCKWTNWNTGVHTALIARWPGRVPAGQRTAAIVQYADVLPTLVEVAGGTPRSHQFDGKSFLQSMLGNAAGHRPYAFALHNNLPEGPAYPIRSITDGQFRYIRNLRADELFIVKYLMGLSGDGSLNNPYWSTWVFQSWNNDRTYELVKRYTLRPAEQLYHTAADPYELTNLAEDPAYAEVKARLSRELDQWLTAQGDPGIAQDTPEALQAARSGNHLYGPTN